MTEEEAAVLRVIQRCFGPLPGSLLELRKAIASQLEYAEALVAKSRDQLAAIDLLEVRAETNEELEPGA